MADLPIARSSSPWRSRTLPHVLSTRGFSTGSTPAGYRTFFRDRIGGPVAGCLGNAGIAWPTRVDVLADSGALLGHWRQRQYLAETLLSRQHQIAAAWPTAVLNARQFSRLQRLLPSGIVRVITAQAGGKRIARAGRSRRVGSI
jgi:hypothetical protein